MSKRMLAGLGMYSLVLHFGSWTGWFSAGLPMMTPVHISTTWDRRLNPVTAKCVDNPSRLRSPAGNTLKMISIL